MLRRFSLVVLVGLVVLATLSPALAQSRSVFWERWDVAIDNVDVVANRFDVAEIYDVQFSGSFRFGSRVIETTNLTDIQDVQVYQDGRPLQPSCSEQPGTFCVRDTSDGLSITYYFFRPLTNATEQFRIEYTVVGALRVYEGGDQLWWSAIPPEHFGFEIGSSTVTVDLPEGYGPRGNIDPVVTYGAPTTVEVDGTQVVAKSTRQIGGDEALEIRVQFPHNPAAQPPAWQGNFDQQRAFEENVQPIINILVLVLALLIAVGGPLIVYSFWRERGRDPKVGPVPTYLTEPPSALSPAVVGALLDEKADLRDVMSVLIDLAHRQYLVIEEEQKTGLFGIGRSSEFTFKRTDKPTDDLRPFERRVFSAVFSGGKMERSLDSLRNKFYTVIPEVQGDLYDELVELNLFRAKPSTTRALWSAVGGVIIFLAFAGLWVAAVLADNLTPALMCIPAALFVTGMVALIVAQFMPAKTREGAEQAAKWKAFLEYLRNLDKYGTVEEAARHFDDYLPYAVAFGIERTWMQRFQGLDDVPIPPWYFPTYVGGPWGRGYVPGTPLGRYTGGNGSGLPGELARAGDGGFTLDDVSGRMSAGLENLSSGLTTMLESASRVMTSKPQSASGSGRWSGGGSSWSGGGFSGGGSSGGGSSGFG